LLLSIKEKELLDVGIACATGITLYVLFKLFKIKGKKRYPINLPGR